MYLWGLLVKGAEGSGWEGKEGVREFVVCLMKKKKSRRLLFRTTLYTLRQLFPSTDPKQNLFYVCYGFVYRLNIT